MAVRPCGSARGIPRPVPRQYRRHPIQTWESLDRQPSVGPCTPTGVLFVWLLARPSHRAQGVPPRAARAKGAVVGDSTLQVGKSWTLRQYFFEALNRAQVAAAGAGFRHSKNLGDL